MQKQPAMASVRNVASCTTYEKGKPPDEWYVVELRLNDASHCIITRRHFKVGQEVAVVIILDGTLTDIRLVED